MTIAIITLPLLGSLVSGLFGKKIGTTWSYRLTIFYVFISFLLSICISKWILIEHLGPFNLNIYNWGITGHFTFEAGFLIDPLTCIMLLVVTFVSLLVHIYSIGYMQDDPGYQRFFSYVSLFTFAMLALITANNFLQLFFGWEGVGLVSYLLIGFWFNKESAAQGSLKAFLVNRVGDFGFLLGIALILMTFHSISYIPIFNHVSEVSHDTISIFSNHPWSVITVICILLFIGAMGKSAQIPLHVWLPESMEGPTPISALIHAATMVTAGIYMVARMSPLFEYSQAVLSLILVIGGTTAFFTGLVAVVQYDIKRVIAYSTLSQLGYMAVALGASAYDVAIFHLITHAFFKALLFLASGSVIIALHHEQDMRRMGGLAAYMPITYLTFIIGSLALCAIPPFAGFYSKDTIIDAVHFSTIPGAHYAYYCVLAGAFVTSLYTFRALFMTFHGKERLPAALKGRVQESPWVVLFPLVMLAIPSVISGEILIRPMLYAKQTLLGNTIFVLPQHNALPQLAEEFHGAQLMALKAGTTPTFWIAMAGILTAWFFTIFPQWAEVLKKRFAVIYAILLRKYGFDDFNQIVLVHGTQDLGSLFYKVSDVKLIDGVAVNGSGRFIRWIAQTARKVQTGYLYHYAFAMVLGMVALLVWYMAGL